MTNVRIFHSDGMIYGVEAEGHSGYAESGSDIVCAAVTTAIRLAEAILNDAMLLGATVKVNEQTARISLMCNNEAAQAVFNGFAVLAEQLEAEYPNYISVRKEGNRHA